MKYFLLFSLVSTIGSVHFRLIDLLLASTLFQVLGICVENSNGEGMGNLQAAFMEPFARVLSSDYKHCNIDPVELLAKVGQEHIKLQRSKGVAIPSENRSKRSFKTATKAVIKYIKKDKLPFSVIGKRKRSIPDNQTSNHLNIDPKR